jgi:hypothetical protein
MAKKEDELRVPTPVPKEDRPRHSQKPRRVPRDQEETVRMTPSHVDELLQQSGASREELESTIPRLQPMRTIPPPATHQALKAPPKLWPWLLVAAVVVGFGGRVAGLW